MRKKLEADAQLLVIIKLVNKDLKLGMSHLLKKFEENMGKFDEKTTSTKNGNHRKG